MNQLQVIGNLTRDAEVKQSQNGDNYLKFSVAVNTGKDKEAIFVNVSQRQYPNQTNGILPYLLKGQKVFVQGQIGISCYQGKDGQWHPDLTCWADKIELCGGTDKTAQPSQEGQPAAQQAVQGNVLYPNQQQGMPVQESTSDLPF